ncbi:MAG: 23S rRNA (uracil1939-C5)-methyltransferase, partial [Saprospiraceae bacterium]
SPERVNLEELNFVHLDLYSETALRTFKARSESSSYDTFIVDPPRKGFSNLFEWVKEFNPKQIVYASCNAATMVRDLQKLFKEYEIKSIHLIDLFPGTYHYETVVTLSLR